MLFEVLMDMLAEKLNMDPLDLRLKNVDREGSTTPTGQVPDSLSLPEMFEKLRPKYAEAKARAQKSSTDEHKCGVGLSVWIYGCGLVSPKVSILSIRGGVSDGIDFAILKTNWIFLSAGKRF